MGRLSHRKFNDGLSHVDSDNYFDLTSFAAFLSSFSFIAKDVIDDIIDFVVFDCGINCDAEISKMSEEKRVKIFDEINKII